MVNQGKIPEQVMINAHPDTFIDFGYKYMLNWAFIETKNIPNGSSSDLNFLSNISFRE